MKILTYCVEHVSKNQTQHEQTESELKRRNSGDITNQWLTRDYLVFNLVHDVRTSMPCRSAG
jgi:hypothetical protein